MGRMSWVGAISVTCATVCYLVALCMFFKPNAKIKALRMAGYLMLVFFLASVGLTIIRWFQVFSYRLAKRSEDSYYYKKRKRFRAALITLGVFCTLFVLVSGVGIFLFANIFSNVTGGLLDRANTMLEVSGDNTTSTTTPSTESEDNQVGDDDLETAPEETDATETEPSGRGGRVRGRLKNREKRGRFSNKDGCRFGRCKDEEEEKDASEDDPEPAEDSNSEDPAVGDSDNENPEPVDDTSEEVPEPEDDTTNEDPDSAEETGEDASEPATDSPTSTEPSADGPYAHCKNETAYPTLRDRRKCKKGKPIEPEGPQHCKNQTTYPTFRDRQQCRLEALEAKQQGFVTEKYILAAFLGLSFIGHLIHVCVSLCCNGDPADQKDDGGEWAQFMNQG